MLIKNLRQDVKKLLQHVIDDFEVDIEPKIELNNLTSDKGVFASPMGFALASELGKSPEQISQEIVDRISDLPEMVEQVKSVSGYVNFHLDEEKYLAEVIDQITIENDMYGHFKGDKLAIMDECSPNLAKPMHVGHLRNAVLSECLNNVLENQGYNVLSDNHLGDWGLQYGILIYAFKKWGNEEELESNPIEHLLEIYQKFGKLESELEGKEKEELRDKGRNWFRKQELERNEEAMELWSRFYDVSVQRFKETLSMLGIDFDMWIGESFYVLHGITEDIIDTLLEQRIAEEKEDGSVVTEVGEPDPETGEKDEFVLLKSDGTTLYSTRDLATIKYRFSKWDPDNIYYIVASEQDEYFEDVFEVAGRMGYDEDKLYHISYGMLSLPEGSMSTRKGVIVTTRDVLDELEDKAYEIVSENREDLDESTRENISKKVGLAAIKYGILKYSRKRDVVFDKDEATKFEGETGPYLQYSLSRAYSILDKDPFLKHPEEYKFNEIGKEIIDKLARYPIVLERVVQKLDPHELAKYTFELAELFNTFYHECPVIDAEDELVKQSRKSLLKVYIQVMENALDLMGIDTLEDM